jgi:hypothetical protein
MKKLLIFAVVLLTFTACSKETIDASLPESDLIIDAQYQSPEGIKHSNTIYIRR